MATTGKVLVEGEKEKERSEPMSVTIGIHGAAPEKTQSTGGNREEKQRPIRVNRLEVGLSSIDHSGSSAVEPNVSPIKPRAKVSLLGSEVQSGAMELDDDPADELARQLEREELKLTKFQQDELEKRAKEMELLKEKLFQLESIVSQKGIEKRSEENNIFKRLVQEAVESSFSRVQLSTNSKNNSIRKSSMKVPTPKFDLKFISCPDRKENTSRFYRYWIAAVDFLKMSDMGEKEKVSWILINMDNNIKNLVRPHHQNCKDLTELAQLLINTEACKIDAPDESWLQSVEHKEGQSVSEYIAHLIWLSQL